MTASTDGMIQCRQQAVALSGNNDERRGRLCEGKDHASRRLIKMQQWHCIPASDRPWCVVIRRPGRDKEKSKDRANEWNPPGSAASTAAGGNSAPSGHCSHCSHNCCEVKESQRHTDLAAQRPCSPAGPRRVETAQHPIANRALGAQAARGRQITDGPFIGSPLQPLLSCTVAAASPPPLFYFIFTYAHCHPLPLTFLYARPPTFLAHFLRPQRCFGSASWISVCMYVTTSTHTCCSREWDVHRYVGS